MPYKSDTHPRCRYCGELIRKYTHTVWFNRPRSGRPEIPRTKEEAQKLINGVITSVRWERYDPDALCKVVGKPEYDYIDWIGVWDGESYVHEFFCNGEHAKQFANLMASNGHVTRAFIAKGGA
jgi:predicted RNA-binding Zn-ribbon protein involved in translation (DUF1610 family)